MKLVSSLILCVSVVALATFVGGQAQAEGTTRLRIVLMNDRVVEGDARELPDGSYEVTTRHGAIVHIRRNEIKRLRNLNDADTAAASPGGPKTSRGNPGAPRARVTDEEIEALLAGIELDADAVPEAESDPAGALPTDEAGVRDMRAFVGSKGQVYETDHFTLVYTSERSIARSLAARLEAIYRWNVHFLDMMGVPAKRPRFRLKIYFFGDHDEFRKYQVQLGQQPEDNVLGFYQPDENFSAFFDLDTWPPIANLRERLKAADPHTRRLIGNLLRRGRDYKNLEVIQHEAAHHIHFNIGTFNPGAFPTEPPRWLGEGLAMMFEVPPSSTGASLGALNNYRVFEFRQTFGQLKSFPLDHLRGILTDDHNWFNGYNYPLGWAIVNYLYRTKRSEFARFMQQVAERPDGAALSPSERLREFEEFFGSVDSQWAEQFFKYMLGLPVRISELPTF